MNNLSLKSNLSPCRQQLGGLKWSSAVWEVQRGGLLAHGCRHPTKCLLNLGVYRGLSQLFVTVNKCLTRTTWRRESFCGAHSFRRLVSGQLLLGSGSEIRQNFRAEWHGGGKQSAHGSQEARGWTWPTTQGIAYNESCDISFNLEHPFSEITREEKFGISKCNKSTWTTSISPNKDTGLQSLHSDYF